MSCGLQVEDDNGLGTHEFLRLCQLLGAEPYLAGNVGTEGFSVYGATKAGVRSLARTWTTELAPRGIRVNVVSPGPTDTAMFDSVPEAIRSELASTIPLGRLGRPEEIAAAALFLASDESSFIAGVELCVDGGLSQV